MDKLIAKYHLPGLFEFYDFYKAFLPLYRSNSQYFYDWVRIESLYGAWGDLIWGGGRFGSDENITKEVLELVKEYDISPRLTFSNSLLRQEHLLDKKCNKICQLFESMQGPKKGIIIHSDLLLDYLKKNYPSFYFISSTTKVLTDFEDFRAEINRPEFSYVVPDFRLNKAFDKLDRLSQDQKDKVEFLVNECCYVGCKDRKTCYENVSRRILGEEEREHMCQAPGGNEGYLFSKAMKNPMFIGLEDIKNTYLPKGFSSFKIEGRGLGSAILLEFILYYMVKPECQLEVREKLYLDSMLNLF